MLIHDAFIVCLCVLSKLSKWLVFKSLFNFYWTLMIGKGTSSIAHTTQKIQIQPTHLIIQSIMFINDSSNRHGAPKCFPCLKFVCWFLNVNFTKDDMKKWNLYFDYILFIFPWGVFDSLFKKKKNWLYFVYI